MDIPAPQAKASHPAASDKHTFDSRPQRPIPLQLFRALQFTDPKATQRGSLVCILTILFFVVSYYKKTKGFHLDDSFITYQYVRNFLEGNGLTFNAGEKFYGSTAIGYAVLMGISSKIIHIIMAVVGHNITIEQLIPIVATAASALSLGALLYVLYRCAVPGGFPALLLFLLISLPASRVFAFDTVSGHETLVFLALSIAGAHITIAKRTNILGPIIICLALMCRPDAALFGILTLIFDGLLFWRESRENSLATELWRKYCPAIFCGLAYLGFLYLYYGQIYPETLYAKKAQIFVGFQKIFSLSLISDKILTPNRLPFFYQIALGSFLLVINSAVKLWRQETLSTALITGLISLLFALIYTTTYCLLTVTFWEWYLTPIVVALWISGGIGFFSCLPLFKKDNFGKLSCHPILLPLFLLALILPELHQNWKWTTYPLNNTHIGSYTPAVQWLKEKEPEGTSIALAEPGHFAYLLGKKYHVIDVLGLISPMVARNIINGNLDYPFERWKPKYFIETWRGKYNPTLRPWFPQKYSKVAELEHPHWTKSDLSIMIYKRNE